MSTDLSQLLKSLDKHQFDVADRVVICWFGKKGESRRHAVRLSEVDGAIRMEATVATAATVDLMDDPHLWTWRVNRASNLVGFRVNGQKRLLAEAVAPTIALSNEEFVTYLLAVAVEADRMELVLTATDVQ